MMFAHHEAVHLAGELAALGAAGIGIMSTALVVRWRTRSGQDPDVIVVDDRDDTDLATT